ncbi:hypothetical protein H0H93_003068 [Arthromyces matolae]|nr:hypothetical protein H0H93_003068 [Arthromyces matolae]
MRMRTFAIVVSVSGYYLLSSVSVGATPIPPNHTIGSDMRNANHVPRDPSLITPGTTVQLFPRMNDGKGATPSTTTLSKPPQRTDESSHTVGIAWDDVKDRYSIPDDLYSAFQSRYKDAHFWAGQLALSPRIKDSEGHLLTMPILDSFRELREFDTLLVAWWSRLGHEGFPQQECHHFQNALTFARNTLTAVREEIPEPFRNQHPDVALSLCLDFLQREVDKKFEVKSDTKDTI